MFLKNVEYGQVNRSKKISIERVVGSDALASHHRLNAFEMYKIENSLCEKKI